MPQRHRYSKNRFHRRTGRRTQDTRVEIAQSIEENRDDTKEEAGLEDEPVSAKLEAVGDEQVEATVEGSHKKRERERHSCPYGCSEEYSAIHAHFKLHHGNARVYDCDVCHSGYDFPAPSRRHVAAAYPVPISSYVVAQDGTSEYRHRDLIPLQVITTNEDTFSVTTTDSSAKRHRNKRSLPGSSQPRAKRKCFPLYEDGDSVKLVDGSYFRIVKLCRDASWQQIYRGHRLILQNILKEQILPPKDNELLWVMEQGPNDETAHETFTASVRPADIAQRCRIVFTNDLLGEQQSQDPAKPILYCRWKVVIHACVNGSANFNQPCGIMSIERIAEAEADHDARVEDAKLRKDRRGTQTNPPVHCNHGTVYTMGDAFCGVGGVSRGALDANLEVKWGFDSDKEAIEAYWRNFGRLGTVCKNLDVQQFIRTCNEERVVDILHASPPCQAFSREYATAERQKMKELVQTVTALVQATKPRLVCFEEVPKLCDVVNMHHFRTLIQSLISLAYSVRWRMIKCWRYGVPQSRERLFLFAAAWVMIS